MIGIMIVMTDLREDDSLCLGRQADIDDYGGCSSGPDLLGPQAEVVSMSA
jgi:hypothetical protein